MMTGTAHNTFWLVTIPWIHQLSQLSMHHLIHLLSPHLINWVIRITGSWHRKLTRVLLKSWYEISITASLVRGPVISPKRENALIWSDIYGLINPCLMFQITFSSLWLGTPFRKVCSIILAEGEVCPSTKSMRYLHFPNHQEHPQ